MSGFGIYSIIPSPSRHGIGMRMLTMPSWSRSVSSPTRPSFFNAPGSCSRLTQMLRSIRDFGFSSARVPRRFTHLRRHPSLWSNECIVFIPSRRFSSSVSSPDALHICRIWMSRERGHSTRSATCGGISSRCVVSRRIRRGVRLMRRASQSWKESCSFHQWLARRVHCTDLVTGDLTTRTSARVLSRHSCSDIVICVPSCKSMRYEPENDRFSSRRKAQLNSWIGCKLHHHAFDFFRKLNMRLSAEEPPRQFCRNFQIVRPDLM